MTLQDLKPGLLDQVNLKIFNDLKNGFSEDTFLAILDT